MRFAGFLAAALSVAPAGASGPVYPVTPRSLEESAADLASRTTLEEEREKLEAVLDQNLEGGCGCPEKIALYENAVIDARRAIRGESVAEILKASEAVREARESVGYRVGTDKSALKAAIDARVREFTRYTAESAEEYKTLFRNAEKVFEDDASSQLAVNRALRSLKGSDAILKVRSDEPRPLATLIDGEKSVESHGLLVGESSDVDLAGRRQPMEQRHLRQDDGPQCPGVHRQTCGPVIPKGNGQ